MYIPNTNEMQMLHNKHHCYWFTFTNCISVQFKISWNTFYVMTQILSDINDNG